jgi:hypothetical protein
MNKLRLLGVITRRGRRPQLEDEILLGILLSSYIVFCLFIIIDMNGVKRCGNGPGASTSSKRLNRQV